jgi:hypothetical protein
MDDEKYAPPANPGSTNPFVRLGCNYTLKISSRNQKPGLWCSAVQLTAECSTDEQPGICKDHRCGLVLAAMSLY